MQLCLSFRQLAGLLNEIVKQAFLLSMLGYVQNYMSAHKLSLGVSKILGPDSQKLDRDSCKMANPRLSCKPGTCLHHWLWPLHVHRNITIVKNWPDTARACRRAAAEDAAMWRLREWARVLGVLVGARMMGPGCSHLLRTLLLAYRTLKAAARVLVAPKGRLNPYTLCP